MLSKIVQGYIDQQIQLSLESSLELASEIALARAVGAIDLLHLQNQINATEYLAQHAVIKQAREQRFASARASTEVHQV